MSVDSEVGLGNPSTRNILSPPPTPSWTPKHSSKPSSAHVPAPRALGEALLHPGNPPRGTDPSSVSSVSDKIFWLCFADCFHSISGASFAVTPEPLLLTGYGPKSIREAVIFFSFQHPLPAEACPADDISAETNSALMESILLYFVSKTAFLVEITWRTVHKG